jgi:hypothetical protein
MHFIFGNQKSHLKSFQFIWLIYYFVGTMHRADSRLQTNKMTRSNYASQSYNYHSPSPFYKAMAAITAAPIIPAPTLKPLPALVVAVAGAEDEDFEAEDEDEAVPADDAAEAADEVALETAEAAEEAADETAEDALDAAEAAVLEAPPAVARAQI